MTKAIGKKVFRVGFAAVPGAGKTSTARALSAFCRRNSRFEKVELIAEYARRYISKYGSVDSVADQYKIMEKQLEWEDTPAETDVDLIITDSPVHLGWLYVMEFRRETQRDIMYINDIFKRMNKVNFPPRYDIVFHLPPVLPPVKDGIRATQHFDDAWRKESDQIIQLIFKLFPPKKFVTIRSVDLAERIDECMDHLDGMVKEE